MTKLVFTRGARALLPLLAAAPAACVEPAPAPPAAAAPATDPIFHTDNVAECAPTEAQKKPPLEQLTGAGLGSTSLLARNDGWAFAKTTQLNLPRPWVFATADPRKVVTMTKVHDNLGTPGVGDLDGDGLDELVALYEFGGALYVGHESADDASDAAKELNPTRSAWPIKGLEAGDAGFRDFTAPPVHGVGLLDLDLDLQLDLAAVTDVWTARVAYLDQVNAKPGLPTRTLKARRVDALDAVGAPAAKLKSVRFGDAWNDGITRAVAIPVGSMTVAGTEAAPYDRLYVGSFDGGAKKVGWVEYRFPGLLHIADAFPRRKNDGKTEIVILATNKRGEAGVQVFALAANGTKTEKAAFHRLAELDDSARLVGDWEGMVKLVTLDQRVMKKGDGGEVSPQDEAVHCAYLGPDNKAGAIRCWAIDAAGKPGLSHPVLPKGQTIRGWLVSGNFGGRSEAVTYKGAFWGGAVAKPVAMVFPPPSWMPFAGGVNSATATYGTSDGALTSTQKDTQVTRSTALGRHYATGGKIAGQEVQVSADFTNAWQKITGEIESSTATKMDTALSTSRDAPTVMYMESCAIHFVYQHKRGKPLGYRSGYVKDGLETVVLTKPLKSPAGKAETWLRVADLAKWNAKVKDAKRHELMIRDGGRMPPAAEVALYKHVVPHVPGLPWTYYRSTFKPNDDTPAAIAGKTLRGVAIAAERYEHITKKMVETKDSSDTSGLSMDKQHDATTGKIEGKGTDETQAYGVRGTFTAGLPYLAEANTSVGVDVTLQEGQVTTTSAMTGWIKSSSWSIDVPGLGGELEFYNDKKAYTDTRKIKRDTHKDLWERFHFFVKPYVYHHRLDDVTSIMVMDFAVKFQKDPWFHPYRTDSDLAGGATKEETLKVGQRYCDRLFGQHVIEVTEGKGGMVVADCNAELLDGVCWDPMAGEPARPQGKAACMKKNRARAEAALVRLDVCPGGCLFASCASDHDVLSPAGTVTPCASGERCAVVGVEATCVAAEAACIYDGVQVPDGGVCGVPGVGWTGEPDAVLIGGEVELPSACGPEQETPVRIYCDGGVVRADPCSSGCRVAGAGVACGETFASEPPDLCPRAARCTGGDVEVCDLDGAWRKGAECGSAPCIEDDANAACVVQ